MTKNFFIRQLQCNELAEIIQNHNNMKPFGRSDVSQYYLCCKSVSNSGLARIFTKTEKYVLDSTWRCNCFTGHLRHGKHFCQPYGKAKEDCVVCDRCADTFCRPAGLFPSTIASLRVSTWYWLWRPVSEW